MCLGVCGPSQTPCTGRALSASKFHLKETKTHGNRKENMNSGGRGLADRLQSWIKNKTWKPMQTQKSHSGWDFSEPARWEIFKKWIKRLFPRANELNWLWHESGFCEEDLHYGRSWAASAKLQLRATEMCSTDAAVVEVTRFHHIAALAAVLTETHTGIHMIWRKKEKKICLFLSCFPETEWWKIKMLWILLSCF